jgi:hypothetical protein
MQPELPRELAQMLASAAALDGAVQPGLGASAHFHLHIGIRYRFIPVEAALGPGLVQLDADESYRLLSIDSADGDRHLYGFSEDDVVNLTRRMAEAFPGYIGRARALLDELEEQDGPGSS